LGYISVYVCVLHIQHIDTFETVVIINKCWNKFHAYLLHCLLLTVSMPLPTVNWKLCLTTFFIRKSWFYPQIWSVAQFYCTHMKISAWCKGAGGLNSWSTYIWVFFQFLWLALKSLQYSHLKVICVRSVEHGDVLSF